MAFVPIVRACSVEVRCVQWGQRSEITLGFQRDTTIDEASLVVIADAVDLWWYTYGRPLMHSGVSLREVYARDLTTITGPVYTSTVHTGALGTLSSGGASANNVAKSIAFKTALRGRANRGRNYWFGFGANQIANSAITASYRNLLKAMYERLLPGGGSTPAGWTWVVLSRQLNGVTVGRAVPITSVAVPSDAIDSMRTRLPGRGL